MPHNIPGSNTPSNSHQLEATRRKFVFLHGFSQSGQIFIPLIEKLIEHLSNYSLDFEAIMVDLPGHGRSSDVELTPTELVEKINLLSPSVIIGYSLGGRSALLAALKKECEALILISSSPGIKEQKARDARKKEDNLLANSIEEGGDKGINEFLMKWFSQPIFSTYTPLVGDLSLRRLNKAQGLSYSLKEHGQGNFEPLWHQLKGIKSPTLILVGERDLKYVEIGNEMKKEIPTSSIYKIPNKGHSLFLEDKDAVASQIVSFIRSINL